MQPHGPPAAAAVKGLEAPALAVEPWSACQARELDLPAWPEAAQPFEPAAQPGRLGLLQLLS
eukprot:9375420-Lingulodinium_polyedra.AAC.1